MQAVYDLSAGKYDLTVEAGPSFTTRREEAANQMLDLIRAFPEAASVLGDLLAKNLDWPGADEIAERLKMMLNDAPRSRSDAGAQIDLHQRRPSPHRTMETKMQLKTTLLALAAGLTLALPAAAMAQPYGYGYGYGYVRHDDGRWIEREREFRRAEAFRRMEWRREHAFRDYGYRGDYGR